ncbi:hypothetical protein GQ55_9G447400 [Panicum hallii var. hallii]|uniref:Uncharacterized protein n=1 Tax=Panicum hallii var. hallii TaxID=1504633 RepID=A0A2T7CBM5_9POAL|nr:hypothetical protein GQ55_9G447400 [Panicum hallii var. hallii]
MGIMKWMQSRFHGKTENRSFDGAAAVSSSRGAGVHEKPQIIYESEKHLSTDQWPQAGLLSIGTLGNDESARPQEEDLPEFTVEEVKKLQDALARLLRRAKSKSSVRGSGAGDDRPPLDRFLNCPSCLEVDRRVQTPKNGESDGQTGDLSPDTKIILTRARDLLDNSSASGSIKQKPFKFLLKKMFVCNGGFSAPARSLKDPVESRMEKFFRTMLGKKMNARSDNGTASSRRKYFLEDGTKGKRRGGRRCGCEEEREESCRWDRTDSEFIVLEI